MCVVVCVRVNASGVCDGGRVVVSVVGGCGGWVWLGGWWPVGPVSVWSLDVVRWMCEDGLCVCVVGVVWWLWLVGGRCGCVGVSVWCVPSMAVRVGVLVDVVGGCGWPVCVAGVVGGCCVAGVWPWVCSGGCRLVCV